MKRAIIPLHHPPRMVWTFTAVTMPSVNRFICHFLIVWLALLSGGAHAQATADAAHELGHAIAHAVEAEVALAASAAHTPTQGTEPTDATPGHDHPDTCGLSHCGHGHNTGVPTSAHHRLADAGSTAPLATLQSWASREQPNNIERPKWVFTTPSVVNL